MGIIKLLLLNQGFRFYAAMAQRSSHQWAQSQRNPNLGGDELAAGNRECRKFTQVDLMISGLI